MDTGALTHTYAYNIHIKYKESDVCRVACEAERRNSFSFICSEIINVKCVWFRCVALTVQHRHPHTHTHAYCHCNHINRCTGRMYTLIVTGTEPRSRLWLHGKSSSSPSTFDPVSEYPSIPCVKWNIENRHYLKCDASVTYKLAEYFMLFSNGECWWCWWMLNGGEFQCEIR